MKISVCIIAFNEEKNIADAIESVAWADEILVIDSHSTDDTQAIAAGYGVKVLVQEWLGFARQKQFAIDNARFDWILSLDADERISSQLKDEIIQLKLLKGKDLADGYKIPRLSFYMNQPIRHGSWYPDWQMRFFDRRKGAWKDVLIHESFQMSGGTTIAKLSGDILHYSIENAAHHNRMIGERYAPLAAKQMFERGRRATSMKIMTAGLTTFLQHYFLKLGFLDGLAGFCIAHFAAHHTFLKNLFLWEMENTELEKPGDESGINREELKFNKPKSEI